MQAIYSVSDLVGGQFEPIRASRTLVPQLTSLGLNMPRIGSSVNVQSEHSLAKQQFTETFVSAQ